MPRYLYLLRHAQSAEKQVGQTDKERKLTTYGMKQADLIGQFLFQQKSFPDVILCSTSERTRGTTKIITDALKYELHRISYLDEIYEASHQSLLQILAQLEDNLQHVMLVGHNPSVSYLADFLTKAELTEMVPSGMAIIKLNIDSWKEISHGDGELMRYVESEKLNY